MADRLPPRLSPDEEAFLRAFARASLVIPRALDADLMREEQMTLTEYFVLVHLSEAPDRRLRMTDLARASALSLSGMTRVVNHLAALGFVLRIRSTTDGRGWHAVLADAGLERLREAWPSHLRSVRRLLMDPFSGVALSDITEALERTVESGDPACGSACADGDV